jgi:hypothetical protein
VYFLKETADKIQATENDILRRAMLSNNDVSLFSDNTDVFLSIWYTGFLWRRSTEHVLGGLREWNGLIDIRPVDVPLIFASMKPVFLSSFIERYDKYIALESRPAGQSSEIEPYMNAEDTYAGVKSRILEYPEKLVPLIKKVEVSRDNILVSDRNVSLLKMLHASIVNPKAQLHAEPAIQKDVYVKSREEEKPLFNLKAIAFYCGVHIDTIAHWRKKFKDFPASSLATGRVTALPSELNAWMLRNKKNNDTP